MFTISNLLILIHLIGLALGVGSATVKIALLFKCRSNPEFIHVFLKVIRPVTKLIIIGILLLVISGITWIIMGYPLTTNLVIKLILVVLIIVFGSLVDKVAEPKLIKTAPSPGEPVSAEFIRARKLFEILDVTAALLFYAVVILGILI